MTVKIIIRLIILKLSWNSDFCLFILCLLCFTLGVLYWKSHLAISVSSELHILQLLFYQVLGKWNDKIKQSSYSSFCSDIFILLWDCFGAPFGIGVDLKFVGWCAEIYFSTRYWTNAGRYWTLFLFNITAFIHYLVSVICLFAG